MSFAEQLSRVAKSVDKRANMVVKKIVFDLSTSLVLKTPVGDPNYWLSPPPAGYVGGRARGNWQYGVNQINPQNNDAPDKSGRETIAGINAAIPEDCAKVHYLTNSVPYIIRLENGWSRQAPQGMVNLTLLEFEPIVREAAEALKNER